MCSLFFFPLSLRVAPSRHAGEMSVHPSQDRNGWIDGRVDARAPIHPPSIIRAVATHILPRRGWFCHVQKRSCSRRTATRYTPNVRPRAARRLVRQFTVVNLNPKMLSGAFVPGPAGDNEGGTPICPVDAGGCRNNGQGWCECTLGAPSPRAHGRVSRWCVCECCGCCFPVLAVFAQRLERQLMAVHCTGKWTTARTNPNQPLWMIE